MQRMADNDDGNLAAGAAIGFAIGLVIVFVLSPLILSNAAIVQNDSNSTATDDAMVGLLKLAWFIVPVLSAFAGGGLGYARR